MPSGFAAQVRHWNFFRDGRTVALLHHFQFLILVVDDFEEEHPAELGDALGIPIDAAVLAHDVLNGFDGVTDRHGLGSSFIECMLKFMDGLFEAVSSAEGFEEFNGSAHGIEWRNS